MCRLVYGYCGQVVDISNFCLQVRVRGNAAPDAPVLAVAGRLVPSGDYALGDAVFRWMETARRSVLAERPESLPFAPLDLGQPVRSGLYVPIVMGSELLGVITLQSAQAGAFSGEDERFLVSAAAHAALGLHTAQLYRREQERASQLVAIAMVSRKVAAIMDLKTLFADTVRLVQDTFGYYHVSIFSVESERQQMTFQASSSPIIQERGTEVPWGQGLIGHVASTGESLLVNDVQHDARYLPDASLEETRAEAAVPLKVEDRILGVLDVQCNRVGALEEDDLVALLALADQIAIAIEDSRLYEEQQELAWVSTALLQVAQAVGELSTPEEVLDTIIRLTPMLTGVERCIVFLWSEEEGGFVAVKSAGLTRDQVTSLHAQTFAAGAIPVLDRVQSQGQSMTCAAAEFECFLPPAISDEPSTGHVLALPVRSKGQTIGVLVAEDLGADAKMTTHRQTMLTSIANQTALALENARLYTAEREEAWVSTALLQVANLIGTHTDLDQAIASVLRLAPILVGIQWCALWLWDEERRVFYGLTTYALSEELTQALAQHEALPAAIPLLQQIAARQADGQEMRPITTLDPLGEGLLPAALADKLGDSPLTALPLHIQERLLGVLMVAHPEKGKRIAERRMNILDGIAHQIALAIEASQFYQQALRQQRSEREMELARGIQESFLPECCPQLPGWQFAMEWRAARGVGGDFYDLITLSPTHLGLLIADVSDKGVAAALYMALSRTVMRIVAQDTLDPADTLKRVNRILMEDSRSGMFVSMFYAILDLESGLLRYARAGHNPPLVLRAADRSLVRLAPPGVVLGILDEPVIAPDQLQLAPGDALVLYTDGVTEAEDGDHNEFGEERLQEVLLQAPDQAAQIDAETLVERIDAAVRTFTGERPQFDDLTLLAVVRERTAEGASASNEDN
jgi:serine phosphatase RsbU (regulator of sigma subunit)/putative methionine-R-sulfoxide reductase with GAF domain